MPSLSLRATAIESSRTIAMNQRARELKGAGIDIIDLTVGEPDFRPPRAVLEAASRAALSGADRYTPVAGLPALRAAAASDLHEDGGLPCRPEDIIVTPGAKNGLSTAILALINPGDEAIIPLPAWPSYAELVKLAGGLPVGLPTSPACGYKLTPDVLEAALGPRTRLLVLCSPSNPTGAVYSAAELEGLARSLERHPNVWILSDEVYRRIRYVPDVPSPASLPLFRDRCAVIRGLSKSHAMTGWRIGFVAGPERFIQACTAIQGQTVTCAAAISQLAGIAALAGDQAEAHAMVSAYEVRRRNFVAALGSIPGFEIALPDGAFYAYPEISGLLGRTWKGITLNTSDDVALFLLEEARVAVVPGSAFGDDSTLRLSFAAADDALSSAVTRIAQATTLLYGR
ncbi:MAG: pyridoxal phosphate-dependent aminotransferase [Spirochaetales bacterium]|nr:MAG: pyridoxal phosphate-dependent aminotransferase [Spirochaetales bacterium]